MKLTVLNRRHALLLGLASLSLPTELLATPYLVIKAYRNPGCGCCEVWVEHMRKAGFDISMEDDPDLYTRRASLGVPEELAGCHTAVMGDYIIEGHVPPEDVLRLLAERPDSRGLAVPGMPVGSPGMEMGDSHDAYDVVIFEKDGRQSVFKHYPAS
jgi:hypothetical protein